MSDKIGERIEFWKEKSSVKIHISGKVKGWQESLLFAWLLLWTLCGIYIAVYFFQAVVTEQKVFLFVYLIFWGYFEYIVGKTWFWRKWGKEVIYIHEGNLELTDQIREAGKTQRYFTQNISELTLVKNSNLSFVAVYFNSFWVRGGETISFKCLGKEVRFGKQLTEEEAKRLLTVVRKYLKKK
ncbi:MAG: hypothetical protein ACPGEG_07555 [Salibacteraceae bacterium]